jgi:FMN phosphatase YigB (HAD superfamily)
MLQAHAEHELPAAADLIQSVTVRVMGMVGASYARQELEEQNVLALFEEALSALGIQVPRELAQQIHELEYRAVVSERTIPPENLHALEQLRDRGLKLGLVSNAHFLPALMLEDFERLLAELDVAPEETVFVGDKVREDILGPKELGMRAVLTHQFRQEDVDGAVAQPDHVISSLAELVPYVDDLLREASDVPA